MPSLFRPRLTVLIALLYAAGAVVAAWSVTVHTAASAKAVEQILERHVLQNEAAQFLDGFAKEHPVLGMLFASPIKDILELPSPEESSKALNSEVRHLMQEVERQSFVAAWWSWLLVSLSLLYAVAVIAWERSFTARPVLFALCAISLVFFVIGIVAPAMIIWTAPSLAVGSGKLEFVLQHEVRGIAAIIRELFASGHRVIAGFLFLFSILTPLAKAGLTFFVAASRAKGGNARIARLLHAIGKWSMADVFVAGVILSLFALKSQEATKSIPCLGLYYFIGYCLVSMTTAELLMHSEAAGGKPGKEFGRGTVTGLWVVLVCVTAGSALYTQTQYPLDGKREGARSTLLHKLNDADLGPRVHK